MHSELSPEIEPKLRALCSELASRQGWSAALERELYVRMKTRLLRYVYLEEHVSEDEAFALVREHFGEPAAIKEMLDSVHAWQARVTLARRLAAAFVLTLGLHAAWNVFRQVAKLVATLQLNSGKEPDLLVSMLYSVWFGILPAIAAFAITLHFLTHWQRAMERGEERWFLTWTPRKLIVCILLLYLVGNLNVHVVPNKAALDAMRMNSGNGPWILLYGFSFCLALANCILLYWWSDQAPRRQKAVTYAMLAWVASVMAPVLIGNPFSISVCAGPEPCAAFSGLQTLLAFSFPVLGSDWITAVNFNPSPAGLTILLSAGADFVRAIDFLQRMFVQVLLPGLIAALGYWAAQQRGRMDDTQSAEKSD